MSRRRPANVRGIDDDDSLELDESSRSLQNSTLNQALHVRNAINSACQALRLSLEASLKHMEGAQTLKDERMENQLKELERNMNKLVSEQAEKTRLEVVKTTAPRDGDRTTSKIDSMKSLIIDVRDEIERQQESFERQFNILRAEIKASREELGLQDVLRKRVSH